MKLRHWATAIAICLFSFPVAAQDSQANLLFDAVEKNQLDKVTSLIEGGIDVNVQDMLRNTPMHMAAFFGREKVIELLAKKGGDVNAINEAGRSPLYSAVHANHPHAVEALLKLGAKLDARYGQDRKSILHIAAENKRYEAAEKLLEAGADLKAKDGAGKTAVDYAKASKDKELLKLFKDKRWK